MGFLSSIGRQAANFALNKVFSNSEANPSTGEIKVTPSHGTDSFAGGDASQTSVSAGNLFSNKAVDQVLTELSRQSDPDEILKELRFPRSRLRVLMGDDEIFSSFETRRDTLQSVPILVQSIDDSGDDDAHAKWLKSELTKFKTQIICGAFSARPYGYSVVERVYEKTQHPELGEMIGLKLVIEKPFEWFEPKSNGDLYYYPTDGHNILTANLTSSGAEVVDTRYKFLLTRCNPTHRNPYGDSLLSRLYWPWYFRVHGWRFWAKWLERFSSPLLLGKSTNTTAMLNSLVSAHNQAALSVDKQDEVTMISAPSSSSSANFEKFEESLIRRIQKLVLGSTLTTGTDGGGGSRSLGQVHNSVRFDKRNSDILLIGTAFQNVADALCDLNGIPRHEIKFMDGADINLERSKRDRELSATGVTFKKVYYQRHYGMSEDEFEIAEKQKPVDPNNGDLPLEKDDRDRTDQERDPNIDESTVDKPDDGKNSE